MAFLREVYCQHGQTSLSYMRNTEATGALVSNGAMAEVHERAEKGAEESNRQAGAMRYGEQYASGWERSRSRTRGLEAQLEASGEFEQV